MSTPPIVPPPILDPAERAKMDYQDQINQTKDRKERCHRWWVMLVEKGLLAAFIILIGYLVNGWLENRRAMEARALEEYKTTEAKNRFVLEKRYEGITNIAEAMGKVSQVFFSYSDPTSVSYSRPEAQKDYESALKQAADVINKASLVYEVEFDEDVSRYLQIHRSLRRLGVSEWGKYRDWISDLENEWSEVCQLYFLTGKIPEGKRMTLAKIEFSERNKMTPEQYLQSHKTFYEKNHSLRKK